MSDLIGRLLGGGATPSQPKTKLVLDLSRTSFGVGDHVESLSSGRTGWVEAVFTGENAHLVEVQWDSDGETGMERISNLVHVQEFEITECALPEPELGPLEVGDRVRILRSCAHRGEESPSEHQVALVGCEGTVTGLGGKQRNKDQFGDPPYPAGGDTTRYQVKADGDTNIWWYFREALELLTAAVTVGDRVVGMGGCEAVVETMREDELAPLQLRFAVDGSTAWFGYGSVVKNLGQDTFSVGDRVRTVGAATAITDGGGELGVIQRVYEGEPQFGVQYDVKLDSGTTWLFQPGALVLSDDPEPERYRIGDRLEARTGAQAVLEQRLDSGEYQLRLLDGKPLVRSEQLLDERWEVLEGYRDLVLIDDWVVVEGHPLGVREQAVIGEVVKVVEVAHNGSLLVERHGSEADGWWFQFGALALADPPDGEE